MEKIKMKTQKNLIITMLMCLVGFATACENKVIDANDYIKNDDTTSQGGESLESIDAKVENAEKFNGIVSVKLMVYDLSIDAYTELARGDWKDGGFTIEFPKTLDSRHLQVSEYNRGLLEPIADPSLTISVDNRNAKAGTARFFGVDKDGNFVTSFYPVKINEDGKADEAFYSFVDREVTLVGHDAKEAMQDFEVNGVILIALVKTSTTYFVKLNKGWNTWWLSSIRCEQEFSYTNKWSTSPISKLKWYSFEDKWEVIK